MRTMGYIILWLKGVDDSNGIEGSGVGLGSRNLVMEGGKLRALFHLNERRHFP